MMIRGTSPVGTKVCTDSLQERPLTAFRRRYRDSDERHNQCRECFAAYMRYFRAVKRGKLIRRFAVEVKSISSRDVLTAMCAEMAQRLGGVRALCAAWVAHLHAAAEARHGSKMVLDTFRAIDNLMSVAEQQEPEQIDVRELTDDELDFSLREADRRHKEFCERQELSLLMEGAEQLIQSEPEFAMPPPRDSAGRSFRRMRMSTARSSDHMASCSPALCGASSPCSAVSSMLNPGHHCLGGLRSHCCFPHLGSSSAACPVGASRDGGPTAGSPVSRASCARKRSSCPGHPVRGHGEGSSVQDGSPINVSFK